MSRPPTEIVQEIADRGAERARQYERRHARLSLVSVATMIVNAVGNMRRKMKALWVASAAA